MSPFKYKGIELIECFGIFSIIPLFQTQFEKMLHLLDQKVSE